MSPTTALLLPLFVALCAAQDTLPSSTTTTTTPSPADGDGQPLSYGAEPSYAPPQYGPPPPFFGPIYVPPNYDLNYCSVHASFPMVGLGRRNHRGSREHHGRYKRQAYGAPAAAPPAYGQPAPVYGSPVIVTGAAPAGPISNSFFSPNGHHHHHHQHGGFPHHHQHHGGYPGHFHGRRRYYERHSCRFTATFSQATCQSCCRIASRNANTAATEITGALFVFDPETKGDTMPKPETQCVCCAPKKNY
ncbi:unnamed protein product, partial [Mesorhabditis spiculigera]